MNQLSPKMAVKPLPQGTVKIFKLVNVGRLDKHVQIADENGDFGVPMAAFNSSATFIGQTRIFDADEKDVQNRHKKLRYITGTEPYSDDNGKSFKEREIIGNLEFDNRGRCVVKWNDPISKLEYLMRSNENKSNPFRDPSTPALWEEVATTEKSIEDTYDLRILRLDAQNLINTADYATLRQIASGLQIADPNDILLLKNKLWDHAESFPKEVIKAGNNNDLKRKYHVVDAIKFKTVKFDQDTQEWHFQDGQPDTLIVTATTEENINDALIKVINEDKKKHTRLANANKNHLAVYAKQNA